MQAVTDNDKFVVVDLDTGALLNNNVVAVPAKFFSVKANEPEYIVVAIAEKHGTPLFTTGS